MTAHPVRVAAASIDAALKTVADLNPTFMATPDKAAALVELAALEARLAELRMRVLAASDDVAVETADSSPATWLAHHTRARLEDARAEHQLAVSLDRDRQGLAAGLRDGAVNVAQARVIARALDALPDAVPSETVAKAEMFLVEKAGEFTPRQLVRIGRKVLDVVAPEVAEDHEAAYLAGLESHAGKKTRLTMRRLGDGTTRISGLLPDAVATRLATYLEAFTSPRKRLDKTVQDAPSADPVGRLPYPRRLGEAFVQFLETIDPHRLPIHGGDATTVVVTIDFESLKKELGAGELLGSTVPGEDPAAGGITAAQARRLACTAQILPAVLDGDSVPLDLGRAKRLHSRHQRKALLIRDKTCRGEGCSIPGTWAEAHHWTPWSLGGLTSVADGVLLCHHHHHQAHDPRYHAERLASGDVRFHRRR